MKINVRVSIAVSNVAQTAINHLLDRMSTFKVKSDLIFAMPDVTIYNRST